MTQRILVCGGRDYADQAFLFGVLDNECEWEFIEAIIQGGATGADRLARYWAYNNQICMLNFDADWKTHGKAAGPIRNQRMIDEGKPTKVIAMPGGKGTDNMVMLARKAGLTVCDYRNTPYVRSNPQPERRGL